ncbi:hypothetical protein AUJ14_05855 [Candidatus Micrarchaeota archaeon CG1_02_55_22]|nr:MAG: hypothetical protein AUJ14_05855 [Candidatus Micrarchaeota archaeon CG1_02_55_22]
MDEDVILSGVAIFVALCVVLAGGYLSFEASSAVVNTSFDFGAVDSEAYNAPAMASFRAAVEEVSGLKALQASAAASRSLGPLSKAVSGVIGDNYAYRKRLVLSLDAGSELFSAKEKALREARMVSANAEYGAMFLDGTKSLSARVAVLSDRVAIARGGLGAGAEDCTARMASTGISTPNTPLLESIALRLSPAAWLENCALEEGLIESGATSLRLAGVEVDGETAVQKAVRLSAALVEEENEFEDLTDYQPAVIVAVNQVKRLNAKGGELEYEKIFLPSHARIDFSKISVRSGAEVSLSVSAKDALSPEDGYYLVREGGATAFVSTRKLCEESCRFIVTISNAPPA